MIGKMATAGRRPAGVAVERIGPNEVRDELTRSEESMNEDQSTTWEPSMFGMAVDEENAMVGAEVLVEDSVEGKVVARIESAYGATVSVEVV